MKIGVVGAGVFGLAAAIELATRGHQVSVFDQGVVPYPNASSSDVSKGIRRTWYAGDNQTYVELVERSAPQWRDWDEPKNIPVYVACSGPKVLRMASQVADVLIMAMGRGDEDLKYIFGIINNENE